MKIIKGDLIDLALHDRVFDVVAQGNNCFCRQSAGISLQMVKVFQTDNPNYYKLEEITTRGDVNKLGQIDFALHLDFSIETLYKYNVNQLLELQKHYKSLFVVNCYTQFAPGTNPLFPKQPPVDYNAMAMCFTKMNYLFKGLRIGLPLVGGGLAGGNAETIKNLMNYHFKDCDLTLVLYDKN
jgi:hypothetical protein